MTKRLFIVLNKSDYLSDDEVREVESFLRDVLAQRGIHLEEAPVFAVSAGDSLLSRAEGDQQLWDFSGMAALEEHLLAFQIHEKSSALVEALAGKVIAVLDDALRQLALMRRALSMPVDDLDRRLATFERLVTEVQSAQQLALDVLAGDQRRAVEYLEGQAGVLHDHLRAQFRDIAERILSASPDRADVEEQALAAIAESIPGLLEADLARMSEDLRRLLTAMLKPHRERVNDLTKRIYDAAAKSFDCVIR